MDNIIAEKGKVFTSSSYTMENPLGFYGNIFKPTIQRYINYQGVNNSGEVFVENF